MVLDIWEGDVYKSNNMPPMLPPKALQLTGEVELAAPKANRLLGGRAGSQAGSGGQTDSKGSGSKGSASSRRSPSVSDTQARRQADQRYVGSCATRAVSRAGGGGGERLFPPHAHATVCCVGDASSFRNSAG